MKRTFLFLLFLTPLLLVGQGGENALGMVYHTKKGPGMALFAFHFIMTAVYFINRKKSIVKILFFCCAIAPFGIFLLIEGRDWGLSIFGKIYIILAIFSLVLPLFRKPAIDGENS